ncbi:MAG: cysteine desulfurase [Rickettsiales bacterium]|nr:cysteine desulfurase [Rickettsiales bacterium]
MVYLDSGASAQKPSAVIDGMRDVMENSYANIHRGLYGMSLAASELYDEARAKAAAFIGAPSPREIVFTKGTTEAVNLVAHSFGRSLAKGDAVIVSEAEHHSNLLPWMRIRDEAGIELRFMPLLPDGEFDYEWLSKNLGGAKLVAVTGQSNVIGVPTDVGLVCRLAHKAGARVFVDAAQMAVHSPLDVAAADADFLAFSGHKIYGPTGIGVLYGKLDLLREMPPYQLGGDMVDRVGIEKAVWRGVPEKFEAGTPPIVEAAGLGLAFDFINEFGMEKIERESLELTMYAAGKLRGIGGLRILSGARANGIVTFVADGASSFDIGTLLGEKNVCVRVGRHCAEPLHSRLGVTDSVRASFGIYNDAEDVDKFVGALEKVLAMLR